MKKLQMALLLFGVCFVVVFCTGCGASQGNVDTLLTVTGSFSGERVMTCRFSRSDFPEESDQAALDDRIAACPPAMTYTKQIEDTEILYAFTLRFSSYEEYLEKLTALLGDRPFSVYHQADSILTKGFRISEDFDSTAFFHWLLEEKNKGAGPRITMKCGTTAVCLDGVTQETSDHMMVNRTQSLPIDEIEISTVNHGDTADRTFVFKIPKSTILALGNDLTSYFNARGAGAASVTWEEFESGSICTLRFEGLTVERLSQATNRVLNSNLCGKISYEPEGGESTPFSKCSEFQEILDLSAYAGKNGDVVYSYQYQDDSGNQIDQAQRFEKGIWTAEGMVGDGVASITQKGAGMKIKIPGGTDYPVSGAQITLTYEGDDQYTRQIDFLLPKDGADGFDYAVSQLKARDPQVEPVRLENEENLICRLLLSGSSEELSQRLTRLFGEGNQFTYQSQGQGVDLNDAVSITDQIAMGWMFQGENQNVPVTYTVETNGKVNLNSLRYESESRIRNVTITNGSVHETFSLENGNGTVIYNGAQPRFWGVVFYFSLTLLLIAGAIVLVIFLKRRVERPQPENEETKQENDLEQEDSQEPPEEAEETIDDILSKL